MIKTLSDNLAFVNPEFIICIDNGTRKIVE